MIKRVDENGNVRLITNIRKPRKWRRYEYLLSSGTQYIDTNFYPSLNSKIILCYKATKLNSNYIPIGCCSSTDPSANNALKGVIRLLGGVNRVGFGNGSGTTVDISTLNDTSKQTIIFENGKVIINGILVATLPTSTWISTVPLYLFSRNTGGSPTFLFVGLIDYCKIYENNTLVRDFVPAEYNGEYGMWDLVEDKFYGNAGTGTFTVGPEIKNYDEIDEVRKTTSLLPSGVELYDYIQSSGTLWIDTGTKANLYPFKLDIEFMNHTSSGEKDVWGNINSSLGDKYGFVSGVSGLNFFQWGGSYWSKTGATVNQWHVVTYEYPDANNRNMIADGNSYTIATSNNNIILSNSNIYLFSDGPRGNMKFNGKIKYAKIYVGNILVRNMLPCTYLGEPGMWDTVENKFYRNQGTGLFTLGNKITLKEYEYLLTNASNLYIATEVYVDNGHKGEYDMIFKYDSTSTRRLMGPNGQASSYFGAHGDNTYSRNTVGSIYPIGNIDHLYEYFDLINYEVGGYLNGIKYWNGTATSSSGPGYMNLFAMDNGRVSGSGQYFYSGKILYDGKVVRDYVPCSYNGTPGLWDKVEWKFYANAGSGSFTLGPEKASGVYPVSYLYDRTIYEEPDGSKWLRIFHHNDPSARRFTSSDSFTTYIHTSNDLFFDVSWCNTFTLWELMVKLKTTSEATEQKFRWVLNYNPMTATFDLTKKVNVTHNTSSGYTSPNSYWGGLMQLNNNNTYLCGNNGTNGNWWGAIGCKVLYSGGLPGWNSLMVTTGHLDLYIRIA